MASRITIKMMAPITAPPVTSASLLASRGAESSPGLSARAGHDRRIGVRLQRRQALHDRHQLPHPLRAEEGVEPRLEVVAVDRAVGEGGVELGAQLVAQLVRHRGVGTAPVRRGDRQLAHPARVLATAGMTSVPRSSMLRSIVSGAMMALVICRVNRDRPPRAGESAAIFSATVVGLPMK